MTLNEIFEFLVLPAIGWLLMNSNKNGARLTRIETALEILLKKYPKQDNE
jgi:hypothetical protein